MMPRRLSAILVATAASAACSHPSAADPEVRAARQSQLRTIAETCGLPTRALWIDESGGIRLRPSPDERYDVLDCVLARLRESGLAKHMPMAFVGNETPAEEAGNHASPH